PRCAAIACSWGRPSVVLAIVVVNQSIMGWPPLQDKLSTRPSQFRPNLRQSRRWLDRGFHNLLNHDELRQIIRTIGRDRGLEFGFVRGKSTVACDTPDRGCRSLSRAWEAPGTRSGSVRRLQYSAPTGDPGQGAASCKESGVSRTRNRA